MEGRNNRATLSRVSGRNQYLDFLRGVAILMVLGMHCRHFAWLDRVGGNGVDLFFVLSGYLISGLLFAEYKASGALRIGRFLLRRGLKIWPSLYLYLAVMAIPLAYVGQLRSLAPPALLYINYSPPHAGVVGHIWSLAIEEHFYLALPFLLAWLMRRNALKWLPHIYLASIVLCGVARYAQPERSNFATHCRFDTLLLGVLLSYWSHFRPRIMAALSSHWSLLGSGALLGFAWTSGPLYRTAGILALSWGFGLLLAWGVGRKCWVPVIPAIGVYSYSIYLWQQPFAAAVYGTTVSLPMFWILLVSAILLGMVMAHVVEFPVLRLRERLVPKDDEGRNPKAPASGSLVWLRSS